LSRRGSGRDCRCIQPSRSTSLGGIGTLTPSRCALVVRVNDQGASRSSALRPLYGEASQERTCSRRVEPRCAHLRLRGSCVTRGGSGVLLRSCRSASRRCRRGPGRSPRVSAQCAFTRPAGGMPASTWFRNDRRPCAGSRGPYRPGSCATAAPRTNAAAPDPCQRMPYTRGSTSFVVASFSADTRPVHRPDTWLFSAAHEAIRLGRRQGHPACHEPPSRVTCRARVRSSP
jgi:hypothetical protein